MLKFKRLSLLAASLCLAGFAVQIHGKTIFVSLTGLDTNAGTETAPLRTVGRGIMLAQPGDVVLVGPGNYAEEIATARAGRSDARITIDGQNGATVKKILLKHAFNTFQNFTIAGQTQKFAQTIYFDLGAHNCIISNNIVDARRALSVQGIGWNVGSVAPVDPAAASNCLVVSNTVTAILGQVCLSVGGANNLILGNTISNVFQSDIFRLWGRSNILRGNITRDHFNDPATGFHPDWIQTFGQNGRGSEDHLLEQNVAINMPGTQLAQLEPDNVPQIRNWLFRNNVFVGLGLGSSLLIPELKFYNNIVMHCNTNGGAHPLNFGIDVDGGKADNIKIKNNIFLENGDSRTTVGWYGVGATLVGCEADYNFVAKRNGGPVTVGTVPVGLGTHGQFAFFELHGINGGSPGFISVANLNFNLRPDSILKNKGFGLAEVDIDFDGNGRPPIPSIGPFEFLASIQPPSGLRLIP